MVWTAFIAIPEGFNPSLFKYFECLKHPALHLFAQHYSQSLSFRWRQSLQEEVDLMLIGNGILCCVTIPNSFSGSLGGNLSLPFLADFNESIYHIPIGLRFLWFAHV